MENDSPPAILERTENSFQYSTQRTVDVQSQQNGPSTIQKKALARAKKKSEYLLNLISNLDTLIYVEVCTIYYMDCSLFRLILRVLNQMIFFTPKPAFVRPTHHKRPYISAIFIPGIICMLLHIFTARSEAGEVMRGYLHGGVIIDLIGQKGPTSKIHLLLLDILLLVLQCFMLAVSVEKDRLQNILTALSKPGSGFDIPIAELTTAQDYDNEERGLFRNEGTSDDDFELQNLTDTSRSQVARSVIRTDGQRTTVEPTSRQVQEDDEMLELFWSGMTTISDFHIIHNLRRQWQDYGSTTGSALHRFGYATNFAALAANRRMDNPSTGIQQSVNSLSV